MGQVKQRIRPRLRPTSPNCFDGLQIGARRQALIWLEDTEGETLPDVTKSANSSNTYPATTLMSQRKHVEQLFDKACRNFARQVQEEVDKKLDR